MKIGIFSVYVDYHRRGRKNRLAMQPGIGPLLAGLLPPDDEIEVVNETSRDPDWERDYDLLLISSLHPHFDRELHLSQSTISQHINESEEMHQVKRLHPTRRTNTLTPESENLLRHGNQVFQLLENIMR